MTKFLKLIERDPEKNVKNLFIEIPQTKIMKSPKELKLFHEIPEIKEPTNEVFNKIIERDPKKIVKQLVIEIPATRIMESPKILKNLRNISLS